MIECNHRRSNRQRSSLQRHNSHIMFSLSIGVTGFIARFYYMIILSEWSTQLMSCTYCLPNKCNESLNREEKSPLLGLLFSKAEVSKSNDHPVTHFIADAKSVCHQAFCPVTTSPGHDRHGEKHRTERVNERSDFVVGTTVASWLAELLIIIMYQ